MRYLYLLRCLGTVLALSITHQAIAGPLTGRHSADANIESSSPVTVLNADAFARTGITDVTELLGKLPAVSFGNTRLDFDPGTAQVNLRGLGSARTLVLIDGRRIANDGFGFGNAQIPDISEIDRVEVCRDGAAAVYGSDAVAGVVNFITTQREHKRPAFATEVVGTLQNPALSFGYDLKGTGYGVSAGFCLDSGRILPFEVNVDLSGYNLSGNGDVRGLNFAEGFGITGIGGMPGIYVNSPTDLLTGDFDAKRNGALLSVDFGLPLTIDVHGGKGAVGGRTPGLFNFGAVPSVGVLSLHGGLRGGFLDQQETTLFTADTPAFGLNSAWQGDYHTKFDGNVIGAFVGLGYSRTFFGRGNAKTTLSLMGTVGYDNYTFDVSEQVNATGLGGALNYSNAQQYDFSDSLFTSSITASIDWRRDNLTIGGFVSYDCGIDPEIDRFLPDSDLLGALDPVYSLDTAPSAKIGVFARYNF